MVETFLVLPSSDWTVSDPILTSPILYPAFSILFNVICDTSTARPMLRPLALIVTFGWLANWIRVDVTYVMSGFLPMYIVSWGPSLCGVVCFCDYHWRYIIYTEICGQACIL